MREELRIDEAAAALVDVGRVLGLSDEVQKAHLEGLGLQPNQVNQAMKGTAGLSGEVIENE